MLSFFTTDARFVYPIIDRFSLQLISPVSWEIIPSTRLVHCCYCVHGSHIVLTGDTHLSCFIISLMNVSLTSVCLLETTLNTKGHLTKSLWHLYNCALRLTNQVVQIRPHTPEKHFSLFLEITSTQIVKIPVINKFIQGSPHPGGSVAELLGSWN